MLHPFAIFTPAIFKFSLLPRPKPAGASDVHARQPRVRPGISRRQPDRIFIMLFRGGIGRRCGFLLVSEALQIFVEGLRAGNILGARGPGQPDAQRSGDRLRDLILDANNSFVANPEIQGILTEIVQAFTGKNPIAAAIAANSRRRRMPRSTGNRQPF